MSQLITESEFKYTCILGMYNISYTLCYYLT